MNSNIFSIIVRKHFEYLFSEYGFNIIEESYYPEMMGNAHMHLESENCGIQIVFDRMQVLINMGKPNISTNEWFEFADVIRYFAPEIDPIYEFPKEAMDWEPLIEVQVSRLSDLMYSHCKPLMSGDFSMYDGIKEIEKQRVEKMLAEFKSKSEAYNRQTE